MSVTRAEVLRRLRALGYPVASGQLARIMNETSYAVNKALQGLYSRDLIDRKPRLPGGREYVYFSKAVNA